MCPTLANDCKKELLVRVMKSKKEARVGNRVLEDLAYTNDIKFVTEKKKDIEKLLRIEGIR